jgi:hypothetical protein
LQVLSVRAPLPSRSRETPLKHACGGGPGQDSGMPAPPPKNEPTAGCGRQLEQEPRPTPQARLPLRPWAR